MPLTTRVQLWNTTSRETWISIAQRRLRAAASAISGAAIDRWRGARPSNSGERNALEQHGVGVEHEIVEEQAAERDAEQVDVPAGIRSAC